MAYEKNTHSISMQTLKRLPDYLNHLKTLKNTGLVNISATVIANSLNLNEVQVRKDLASVSSSAGKPRTGFAIDELVRDIEAFLGYDSINDAVLVGMGNLGKALFSYKNFKEYGLQIVAGFDSDSAVYGTEVNGKPILPMEKFVDLCRRMQIHIGIIAVPAEHAQSVCNLMAEANILAIWNFAPVNLTVPNHIFVKNESMAASIAIITKYLSEKLADGGSPAQSPL